jgi:hypothetical protein
MISKTQFVILVSALKKHTKYEDKFNKAIGMLNSSHSVLELAPNLFDGVLDALSEDFTSPAHDFIFDYVFNNMRVMEWGEADKDHHKDYSFKVRSPEALYKILCMYFLDEKITNK